MNRLSPYLSWSQPFKTKLIVLGIITLTYLAVFLFLFNPAENYPVAAMVAFLPAVSGGLLFGAVGGLVYSIAIAIFIYVLGLAVGYSFVNLSVTLWGHAFLVAGGVGAGWAREQFAEREQIQRKLQTSEDRLRSVVTNAPVILFALNRDGIFTLSEGSGLAILKLKPGEAVGQSVFELFAQADGFLEEVRRALAGEAFTSISRGRGLAFETRYMPQYDANGQFIGTTAVSVDVLSRIQAEEAYRTLVETSMQGLVILQDRRIVFTNQALVDLTGYSMEQLLALTQEQTLGLVHPDDRAAIARRLQDREDGKTIPSRAEVRMMRKDGAVRWIEMYSTSIEYRGKFAVQVVALDVTERKQMEAAMIETETLRLALRQERELKELKSRFISMVSHQFRTPLSVISTTGYLLENYHDRLPPEKREDYFGKIRSQIDRLDELIENVLTISEKEEKGLPFAPSMIDLEAFCREMTAEIQLTSAALHQLVFTATGDFSAVMVDVKLLRHILSNLLSNAIKYSPNGGEVDFDLKQQDDDAVFQISDAGIGISTDDQKHLFEPFHRGQNVGGIKGSGLGLKIVKDFVDVHGGAITCVSEVGKGTTFTVRLPIVQTILQSEGQGVNDPIRSSGGA